MSFHTVAPLVSGLPFAMGPCGVFFRRLMKSAECAWGMGTPLRMLLIKSTITVNWASSNCPKSRYSNKSWYGTVAAARWMMARRLAMVAQGGGPSEPPARPVMACVPAAHWWLSGNVKLGLIWGSVVHCDVFVLVCCAFCMLGNVHLMFLEVLDTHLVKVQGGGYFFWRRLI